MKPESKSLNAWMHHLLGLPPKPKPRAKSKRQQFLDAKKAALLERAKKQKQ